LPSSLFEKKKNDMTIFITFFNGFVVKKGDNNCPRLFRWFCCEKSDANNVIAFFYGGGAMKNRLLSFILFFLL
jgi:hypothetical protein